MEITAVVGSLALVVLILVRDVVVPMVKKNGNGKSVCPLERDLVEFKATTVIHEKSLERLIEAQEGLVREMREVVNLLRREAA